MVRGFYNNLIDHCLLTPSVIVKKETVEPKMMALQEWSFRGHTPEVRS